MTDDDTADVAVDGVSRLAVVLPVWKLRRCTLECVPWTSTQAVKQQKGQGDCAGRADGQREEQRALFTFALPHHL